MKHVNGDEIFGERPEEEQQAILEMKRAAKATRKEMAEAGLCGRSGKDRRQQEDRRVPNPENDTYFKSTGACQRKSQYRRQWPPRQRGTARANQPHRSFR